MKQIDVNKLVFRLRPEMFCIHRLAPDRPLDFAALRSAAWYSITHTDEELSVVAPQEIDPGPGEREPAWSCLRIAGQLDFSLVGVIATVARILADARVSIFTVSTYDTDYILVKHADIESAIHALTNAGHVVVSDPKP